MSCRFSIETYSTNINIVGWRNYATRTATNGWKVQVDYNATHTRVIINDPANVSFTTSETNYLTVLNDWHLRPAKPKVFHIDGNRLFLIREGSANIMKRTVSGSGGGTIYCQLEWIHQGVQ